MFGGGGDVIARGRSPSSLTAASLSALSVIPCRLRHLALGGGDGHGSAQKPDPAQKGRSGRKRPIRAKEAGRAAA